MKPTVNIKCDEVMYSYVCSGIKQKHIISEDFKAF